MKRIIFALSLVFCASVVVFGQVRPIEKTAVTPVQATGISSVKAKYQGGFFGASEKETGTLKFDDENQRVIFIGKDNREKFGIPYGSLLVISPESRSYSSTTGNVVSHIPLPGAGLANLMRKQNRYLVVQFDDPDADARGVINFRLDNKALLNQVIQTLGQKAKLTQRGDAYYRPRRIKAEI